MYVVSGGVAGHWVNDLLGTPRNSWTSTASIAGQRTGSGGWKERRAYKYSGLVDSAVHEHEESFRENIGDRDRE